MQRNRTYLRVLCTVLILMGVSACIPEFWPSRQSGALSLWPQLYEGLQLSGNKTRTVVPDTTDPVNAGDSVAARDELRENYFRSLDVFVKRTADAENANWFKVYHLYNVEGIEQVKHQIAANWSEEGYLPNVEYDIYATANNNHTREGSASMPASLTALKALTTTTNSIYRFHSETDVPGKNYMRTDDENDGRKKEFLMDAKIEGWQLDPNRFEQVFPMELNRAAAKIIVNVKYSDLKTMVLVSDDMVEPMPQIHNSQGQDSLGTLKVYLENVGRTPGLPRWKYVNFVMEASDIAGGALDGPTPTNKFSTYASNFEAVKAHGDEVPNIDDSYSITTYTYPVDWSNDPSKAPYLLLSVFYVTAENQQWRSYYRIPVCDESKTTSLKRNHIYIVNAEIASLGASNDSFEAPDEELRIEYHVIPWTETNIQQEATVIKISDTKYLTVSPTSYTLKGDSRQAIDLLWYASVSPSDQRYVDIDPSTLHITYVNYQGVETDIKGSVTKQVRDGGSLVTFNENTADGTKDIVITATAPTTTGVSNGEKVIITITPDGIIRVESDALDSRAIKNISFDVKLKNVNDLPAEHVTVRHFPLDNLQSIAGKWASRWDGATGTISGRAYTYDPVASGWDSYDGFEWEECNQNTYYSLEDSERKTEFLHHTDQSFAPSGATNVSSHTVNDAITQSEWAAGIGNNNADRQNANSQANAVNGYYATGGSSTNQTTSNQSFANNAVPTYTWNGTTVTLTCVNRYSQTQTWSYNNYDYISGTTTVQRQGQNYNIRTTLWKYTNYYYTETLYDYDQTHYYRKKYYRTEEITAPPSTGKWVDWERDSAQTYNTANAKYTNGLNFTAKVFNSSDSKIYAIDANQSGSNYTYRRATGQGASDYHVYTTSGNYTTGSNMSNLTNNQMYVVQVTASSTQFVLGKPVLDANYQSQDHVASPAFMIASQLGASSTTTSPTDAATHCGTYMEVGMDGTRYVNWRLPTKEEINVIIEYQDNNKISGTTMVKVLGGNYYWTLDGTSANVPSGSGGSANQAYVRCIRDMSLDEINALNNR